MEERRQETPAEKRVSVLAKPVDRSIGERARRLGVKIDLFSTKEMLDDIEFRKTRDAGKYWKIFEQYAGKTKQGDKLFSDVRRATERVVDTGFSPRAIIQSENAHNKLKKEFRRWYRSTKLAERVKTRP